MLTGCYSTTALSATSSESTTTTTPAATPPPVEVPLVRVPSGSATHLGTGTFTVGTGILTGIYDATSPSGSGNFTIKDASGTLMINEILGVQHGQGTPLVRVVLTQGDVINISGISTVHFQPTIAPFITTPQITTLSTGFFLVDQDVATGRYVVTPVGSGNFMVFDSSGASKVNEILGGDTGVANVTVDIAKGDIIQISGLTDATFTPTN